jgi:hypothetical protein
MTAITCDWTDQILDSDIEYHWFFLELIEISNISIQLMQLPMN